MAFNTTTLNEAFGNVFDGISIKPRPIKLEEIYVDADNVLVGWWSYVEEHHLNRWTQAKLNSLSEQDRNRVLDKVYEEDPDLFAKLKPYTNSVAFLLHLRELGIPVYILTAIGTNHPDPEKVSEDKKDNLFNIYNLNSDRVITVATSDLKQRFSGPGKLLIDDYHRNIREWRLHGGPAIEFDAEKEADYESLFNRVKALMGIAPDTDPVWGSVCKVTKFESSSDEEE